MAQVAFTLAERVLTPPRQEVKVLDVKEARPLPTALALCTLNMRRTSVLASSMSASACMLRTAFAVVVLTVRAERPLGKQAASSWCNQERPMKFIGFSPVVDTPCLLYMQTVRDGRDYIEFEFAAKAGGYIRHALAVVTVGNGAHSFCSTWKGWLERLQG